MNVFSRPLIVLVIGLLVGAGLVFATLHLTGKSNRIAFVNLSQVYTEFTMKKELETKLTNVQQSRKRILDSMGVQLNLLSMRLQGAKLNADDPLQLDFQRRQEEYAYQQQNFESDNQAMTDQYTAQIWKQINQYVQDYAKANNYEFILGGDGSGSLMYGEASRDITKEVNVYINQRYKGVH